MDEFDRDKDGRISIKEVNKEHWPGGPCGINVIFFNADVRRVTRRGMLPRPFPARELHRTRSQLHESNLTRKQLFGKAIS